MNLNIEQFSSLVKDYASLEVDKHNLQGQKRMMEYDDFDCISINQVTQQIERIQAKQSNIMSQLVNSVFSVENISILGEK